MHADMSTLPHAAQVELHSHQALFVTTRGIGGVEFTKVIAVDPYTEERYSIYATDDGFVVSPVVDGRNYWSISQWEKTADGDNTTGRLVKAYRQDLYATGNRHASTALITKPNLTAVAVFITTLRNAYPQEC